MMVIDLHETMGRGDLEPKTSLYVRRPPSAGGRVTRIRFTNRSVDEDLFHFVGAEAAIGVCGAVGDIDVPLRPYKLHHADHDSVPEGER